MIPGDRKVRVLALSSKGGHWIQLTRILGTLTHNQGIVYASSFNTPALPATSENYEVIPDFSRSTWWRLPIALYRIYRIISVHNPTHIITTGAAPGLMAVIVGRLTHRKTLWIDSLANASSLSTSGKVARFFATVTLSQWSDVARKYRNVHYSGNLLENLLV